MGDCKFCGNSADSEDWIPVDLSNWVDDLTICTRCLAVTWLSNGELHTGPIPLDQQSTVVLEKVAR